MCTFDIINKHVLLKFFFKKKSLYNFLEFSNYPIQIILTDIHVYKFNLYTMNYNINDRT